MTPLEIVGIFFVTWLATFVVVELLDTMILWAKGEISSDVEDERDKDD